MVRFGNVLSAFRRKKVINLSDESGLMRSLSTLDLTALGIGSTLGAGVYVVAGQVANEQAGPAVIISFAIAAIASMLAGLCYAEFGARVPKAGSAYVYSYVTMGEFVAFSIGWTLILEYVIGAASVVRTLSGYVDALFDKSMQAAFRSVAEFESDNFSKYPDFFAFGVTVAFSVALSLGARESSLANNLFTLINLGVVLFIIITGSLKANLDNWSVGITQNITNAVQAHCKKEPKTLCTPGSGGFAPFGFPGIIAGAATCFYNFIGFDCVATAGEEAKNPKKSIPIAIVASLTVVFLAYCGVSFVLTTVVPYFELDPDTPFPCLFKSVEMGWASYIVLFGAMSGLLTSLLGALFPLPRIIYAMASDGLIFRCMGAINSRFHTPMTGTLFSGVFTGILAMMFNVDQLVKMMSIGTLLAYSMVAACVLILRYEESVDYEKKVERDPRTLTLIAKKLINSNHSTISTKFTSQIVSWLVFIYAASCVPTAFFITSYGKEILEGCPLTIGILVLIVAYLITILMLIYRQPISEKKLMFSVPLVPFLPALSIFINIGLMVMLDNMTWARFLVWMAIGYVIYFGYGVWNSTCRQKGNTKIDNNTLN